MARRGFLWRLASVAPAIALATTAAPTAAASPPLRESRRLLWLGEQLDAIEATFTAAIASKVEARAAADRQWPAPPASITFPPGTRPPSWCGADAERDIDDRAFYYFGDRVTYRKIADLGQIESYVKASTPTPGAPALRGRDAKDLREARKMLAIARDYEAAREAVIESTGYQKIKDDIYAATRRIDRIAALIYKCESTTFRGLVIKARAALAAIATYTEDNHVAYRSKVLYFERLAESVLVLNEAA